MKPFKLGKAKRWRLETGSKQQVCPAANDKLWPGFTYFFITVLKKANLNIWKHLSFQEVSAKALSVILKFGTKRSNQMLALEDMNHNL